MDIVTRAYTITGLTSGLYYDIVVQAVNVVGGSVLSTATRIVAATAPNTLAMPTVLAQSSTSITIGWVAPTTS